MFALKERPDINGELYNRNFNDINDELNQKNQSTGCFFRWI